MAVRALGAERAAAKVWGFHMDGQVGQGFGQDGIDHALVIGNAAVDQAVEIIRIVNIHAVEVIVFVIGQFADAVDAFEEGDPDKFRRLLTSFLSSIPYTMRRKENEREKERYFHYTFYLIMRLISVYTVYTEKEQSEGRVDCIVETDKYIYIFEFKLDGTAAEALRQIGEKGYARPYLEDSRKLYCIGVSFSSETGTVEDWETAE